MYNPSLHTATNKSIGLTGKPVDARTYYYDSVNFTYRPYVSSAEVLGYLNTADSRKGNFPIIINSGGTLSGGVVTGGVNTEWWFRNGTADGDLVLKTTASGGGGGVEIAFSSASSLTISDWQADIPAGFTETYAELLGNNVPNVVVSIPTGVTDQLWVIPADVKIIRTGGLITSVTIDWSVSYAAGFITF